MFSFDARAKGPISDKEMDRWRRTWEDKEIENNVLGDEEGTEGMGGPVRDTRSVWEEWLWAEGAAVSD